jgi:hypothetical protein
MNQSAGFEPALDSQATGYTSVEALPFHRQAISKYAYIGPTPSDRPRLAFSQPQMTAYISYLDAYLSAISP